MFIVLVAAVVAPLVGEFTSKFGLSVVVLELLLGVIIGPHALGWATPTHAVPYLAQFGMGLKRLLRIRRLHAALDLWLSGAQTNWTRVAASAGYADQPHFIRECRGLLGQAPAAFVARAG